MARFNWRYPLGRLISAGFLTLCWLFVGSGGPDVPLGVAPVICNGDAREYLLVFAQLVGAALFIEILSWAVWYVRDSREVSASQSGMPELNKYKLSGGELLGLEGSTFSLVFAIALIVIGAKVLGVPDLCVPSNLNPFSWRHLTGGLVVMYGILGATNYLLEKVDRASDKLPV
jgi:hypothetical protein